MSRKRRHEDVSESKDGEEAPDETSVDTSLSADDNKDDKDSKAPKKAKNRCGVCRKKVGLTGIECRCGGLFCSLHRYVEEHKCTYDYKEKGAEEIRKNNPVVVKDKIQKI